MKGQLEQYLLGLLPPDNEWVSDLEKQASQDHVPIIDKISVHFLMQLVSISKPQRILEIGTAIGYSALRMLEAYPSTSIVTIERDACRYTQAIENIKRLQQDNHIQVIYGDAKEELSRLSSNEEKFDFVFIDAAKGEYRDRKSTRLNSSHVANSYAVFCLKKKKQAIIIIQVDSELGAVSDDKESGKNVVTVCSSLISY